MELVDRYLEAVKGYLPHNEKAQQDDIIAELKDSLLSRVEEREAELGRALNADELQALVKETGHPMLVASRYLPQRYLIGPSLYPFWWMALRAMLIAVAVVYVVLAVAGFLSDGNFAQALIRGLIQAATGFWQTALLLAAIITAVFWALERNEVRIGLFDRWQPAKLAASVGGIHIKRSESLFELVIGALFIAWWIGAISFPASIWHYGKPVSFAMSSAWNPFWWGILALAVWYLLLSIGNLVSPYVKRDRLVQRILLNAVSIGLLYLLYQYDVLVVAGDGTTNADVQQRLNALLRGTFIVLGLVWAYEIFEDVRRLLRLR
jgi:hypothetical protein